MTDQSQQQSEQKEYVSIFDEERYDRNTKIDESSEVKLSNKKNKIKKLNEKQAQSLLKVDDKLNSVAVNQEKVIQKIDINVIDYETPKRIQFYGSFVRIKSTLYGYQYMQFIVSNSQNKHLIKCGAVLMFRTDIIEFEKDLSAGKYEFLSQFYKKEKMIYFRDVETQEQQNIWSQVFCSKVHDEPSFKSLNNGFKIDRNNALQYDGKFQNVIQSRFSQYILSPEQQKMNLYPVKGMTAYRDYVDLGDNDIAEEVTNKRPLNIVAIDCEMVQTELGLELARITIVDYDFNIIMDEFVMPANNILDYNTKWSGITEAILCDVTTTIENIQVRLKDIIDKDTIIIGHSLENDLHALKMFHDNVIDTSLLFMTQTNRKLSLKSLALKFLSLHIQKDTHDSTEDAKIALALARFRIEILENFSMNSFHSANSTQLNPDVLINLGKMGGVHVVEKQESLEQFPKTSLTCETVFMNEQEKLDRIKNLMMTKGQAPKIVFCEFLEQNCCINQQKLMELDANLKQIYENSPTNTVFILSFQSESKEFQQVNCLDNNMNSFFMFLTK